MKKFTQEQKDLLINTLGLIVEYETKSNVEQYIDFEFIDTLAYFVKVEYDVDDEFYTFYLYTSDCRQVLIHTSDNLLLENINEFKIKLIEFLEKQNKIYYDRIETNDRLIDNLKRGNNEHNQ